MRRICLPRRKRIAIFVVSAIVVLIFIANLRRTSHVVTSTRPLPLRSLPAAAVTPAPPDDFEAFFEFDDNGNLGNGTTEAEPVPKRSPLFDALRPNSSIMTKCAAANHIPQGEKVRMGLLLLEDLALDELIEAWPQIGPGGSWKPPNCLARHKIAIVVPYRDRQEHLTVLLAYLFPLLQHQSLDFRVIVSEQMGDGLFNKGRIMNAAFTFAERLNVDCVIFHDVDMIPESKDLSYACPPIGVASHLGVYVNTLGYHFLYEELVGGVLSLNVADYKEVNGYSTEYWAWGGEDDDMGFRILSRGLNISRPRNDRENRYTMIKHRKRIQTMNKQLVRELLNNTVTNMEDDGVNNPKWTIKKVKTKPLFHHLFVDVGNPPIEWLATTAPSTTMTAKAECHVEVDVSGSGDDSRGIVSSRRNLNRLRLDLIMTQFVESFRLPAFDRDGYIVLDSRWSFVHPDEEMAMAANRFDRDMSHQTVDSRNMGLMIHNELCVPQLQEFQSVKEMAVQAQKKGFVLGAKLGEGQFSKVYVAWHKRKRIAVKVMRLSEIGENYLKKFLPREVECWQHFDHPNLARLLGLVQGHNCLVMFTELAPHGDLLRILLALGDVGFLRCTFWMSQIVKAVDYLHTHRITHRDLKLENCLLFEKEVVKVTDFGFCAHIRDQRMMTSTHCGSRVYSAPEILENREYNPFKSDVWSIGVIAATLVNSSMPFYDDPKDTTNDRVLKQQRNSSITVPPAFGAACQFSINKLLTYEVNDRPDINGAMLLPWWRRLTTSRKSLAQQRFDLFKY